MSDIYRWRADVAKAVGTCPEAEIDILEIASLKIFRKSANGIETVARNIKAKPDAAWHVDRVVRVGNARDMIDPEHLFIAWHRIDIVRHRKRKNIAVV